MPIISHINIVMKDHFRPEVLPVSVLSGYRRNIGGDRKSYLSKQELTSYQLG